MRVARYITFYCNIRRLTCLFRTRRRILKTRYSTGNSRASNKVVLPLSSILSQGMVKPAGQVKRVLRVTPFGTYVRVARYITFHRNIRRLTCRKSFGQGDSVFVVHLRVYMSVVRKCYCYGFILTRPQTFRRNLPLAIMMGYMWNEIVPTAERAQRTFCTFLNLYPAASVDRDRLTFSLLRALHTPNLRRSSSYEQTVW